MNTLESILAALAYHDIFSYPLTAGEIQKFQIKKSTVVQTNEAIGKLQEAKKIAKKNEFYFLSRNPKSVAIRKARQKISAKKIKRANLYASLLKSIPTIKLVAISGALAMGNSTASDDIDFLIITQKNKLWTTRFLANLALLPFKRDPKTPKQKDKACLNLFLDELDLKIKEQNLYTAHEICQLKLLWDRNNTYRKFLQVNSWIKNYLPNWKPEAKSKSPKSRGAVDLSLITDHLSLIENFLKSFQLNYMKSKITTEKIGDKQLFFHPADTQDKVLKRYASKLSRLTK